MLITTKEDLVAAVLSGANFVIDEDGALRSEKERTPKTFDQILAGMSPGSHIRFTLANQALQQNMLNLLGEMAQQPSFFTTLPIVDAEMTPLEIAGNIIKHALRTQRGSNVDPENFVVSALLIRTVEEQQSSHRMNKDLLSACVAEALRCEPIPPMPTVECMRYLIQQVAENTCHQFQTLRELVSSDGHLTPESAVVKGALKYFTENKRAAEPAETDKFNKSLKRIFLTTPVDRTKNFQEIVEMFAMRAEQILPAEQPVETELIRQYLPPAGVEPSVFVQPAGSPGVELSGLAPPAVFSQPPSGPGIQWCGDGARESDSGDCSFEYLWTEMNMTGGFLQQLAQDWPQDRTMEWEPAGGEQTKTCPEAEGGGRGQTADSVMPEPEENFWDQLFQIAQPQAQPVQIADMQDFFVDLQELGSVQIGSVQYPGILHGRERELPADREFQTIGLQHIENVQYIENIQPACVQGHETVRASGEPVMLPQTVMPGTDPIRQELIRIVQSVQSQYTPIDEEILFTYASMLFENSARKENMAAAPDTIQSHLSLMAPYLKNPDLMKSEHGQLNMEIPVVVQAVEYFVHTRAQGQPFDREILGEAVRLLLRASVVEELEGSLPVIVEKYCDAVVRAMEQTAAENPEETIFAYDMAGKAHINLILPAVQKRYPGRSGDLLRRRLAEVMERNVPSYFDSSLSRIQSDLLDALEAPPTRRELVEISSASGYLRMLHPRVKDAMHRVIQNGEKDFPRQSGNVIKFCLRSVLASIPAKEIQIPLLYFIENIHMMLVSLLEAASEDSACKKGDCKPVMIETRLRILLADTHNIFSLPRELVDSVAHTAAEDISGLPWGDTRDSHLHLRALADNILSAQSNPEKVKDDAGLFDPRHPAVIVTLECVVQEVCLTHKNISREFFRYILSGCLCATPVAGVEEPLFSVVRKLADAVLLSLGSRNYQLDRDNVFPGSGELGNFVLCRVSTIFQARKSTSSKPDIHPGFYGMCDSNRLVHNYQAASYYTSRKKANKEMYMRDMLKRIEPRGVLHSFMSMAGSNEGIDAAAKAILAGVANEPCFTDFSNILAADNAFIVEGKISWNHYRTRVITMRHTYEAGLVVNNPFMKNRQEIQTSTLELGIQFDLDQEIPMNGLPQFTSLDIVVKPVDMKQVFPSKTPFKKSVFKKGDCRQVMLESRLRMLLATRRDIFPVSPEVVNSVAYAASVAGEWPPGDGLSHLSPLIEHILSAQSDLITTRDAAGLFDTRQPAVIVALECVVQEMCLIYQNISWKSLRHMVSVLLRATPVARVEGSLISVVRKLADAVLLSLGNHEYQLDQEKIFPGAGELGSFILRRISTTFQARKSAGSKQDIYPDIYPGFYDVCGGTRLTHNYHVVNYVPSSRRRATSKEMYLCDILKRMEPRGVLHSFISMAGSEGGIDAAAKAVLSGEAGEPYFRGFSNILAAGNAFVTDGSISWNHYRTRVITMRHSYTVGLTVNNPFTNTTHNIETAALELGIQFDLDQQVQMNGLPQFTSLDISIKPTKL